RTRARTRQLPGNGAPGSWDVSRTVGTYALDVQRLGALAALADLELDRLTLVEGLVAGAFDVREVDEDVVAVGTRDEAVTLLCVEELDGSLGHCTFLCSTPTGAGDAR